MQKTVLGYVRGDERKKLHERLGGWKYGQRIYRKAVGWLWCGSNFNLCCHHTLSGVMFWATAADKSPVFKETARRSLPYYTLQCRRDGKLQEKKEEEEKSLPRVSLSISMGNTEKR